MLENSLHLVESLDAFPSPANVPIARVDNLHGPPSGAGERIFAVVFLSDLALPGGPSRERELQEHRRWDYWLRHDHAAGRKHRRSLPRDPRQEPILTALSFGGIESTKEWCREAWLARTVESLLHDLRYGLRSLRRSPGYAAVVAVTLALGIGANTAVFSAVNGVLLQPLPYDDGGRLVLLYQQATGVGPARVNFSPLEIADYRERDARLKTFRQNLIDALSGHDRLVAHGYPATIERDVEPGIYAELGGEKAAIETAFAHFRPIERAAALNVSATTEPA